MFVSLLAAFRSEIPPVFNHMSLTVMIKNTEKVPKLPHHRNTTRSFFSFTKVKYHTTSLTAWNKMTHFYWRKHSHKNEYN